MRPRQRRRDDAKPLSYAEYDDELVVRVHVP